MAEDAIIKALGENTGKIVRLRFCDGEVAVANVLLVDDEGVYDVVESSGE